MNNVIFHCDTLGRHEEAVSVFYNDTVSNNLKTFLKSHYTKSFKEIAKYKQ